MAGKAGRTRPGGECMAAGGAADAGRRYLTPRRSETSRRLPSALLEPHRGSHDHVVEPPVELADARARRVDPLGGNRSVRRDDERFPAQGFSVFTQPNRRPGRPVEVFEVRDDPVADVQRLLPIDGGRTLVHEVGRALGDYSEEDEAHYRDHYRTVDGGVPSYEDARVGYVLGTVAGRHPGYRDSEFEDIEADLRNGFRTRHPEWDYDYDQVRPYIREGYTRGRTLSLK